METSKYLGVRIFGFCNGYFGRDSYEDKVIEAIGHDWLVARGLDSSRPEMASFENWEELEKYVSEWSSQEERER